MSFLLGLFYICYNLDSNQALYDGYYKRDAEKQSKGKPPCKRFNMQTVNPLTMHVPIYLITKRKIGLFNSKSYLI